MKTLRMLIDSNVLVPIVAVNCQVCGEPVMAIGNSMMGCDKVGSHECHFVIGSDSDGRSIRKVIRIQSVNRSN